MTMQNGGIADTQHQLSHHQYHQNFAPTNQFAVQTMTGIAAEEERMQMQQQQLFEEYDQLRTLDSGERVLLMLSKRRITMLYRVFVGWKAIMRQKYLKRCQNSHESDSESEVIGEKDGEDEGDQEEINYIPRQNHHRHQEEEPLDYVMMSDLVQEKLPKAKAQRRRFATMGGSHEFDKPKNATKRRNINNFVKQFAAGDSYTDQYSGTDMPHTSQMDSLQEIEHQKRQFLNEFVILDSIHSGAQSEMAALQPPQSESAFCDDEDYDGSRPKDQGTAIQQEVGKNSRQRQQVDQSGITDNAPGQSNAQVKTETQGESSSSRSRSCGSSCSCESSSGSQSDNSQSQSGSSCSSRSGSSSDRSSRCKSDETSEYQCSIATSKYFTKKQLAKLKRIITNFLLLRQKSKLQIHYSKWLRLVGRSTKIRSKKLMPDWSNNQAVTPTQKVIPRQRSAGSLSTEELASLMPASIDLFDPMANPAAPNTNRQGSSRSRRSSTQRERENTKKKVAFAIQSLSPARKVVKSVLLQKNQHWLRQIIQAWSLFAQSQQLKRLKQKERKILAALRQSQAQQVALAQHKPQKRSKQSKRKQHGKQSYRSRRHAPNSGTAEVTEAIQMTNQDAGKQRRRKQPSQGQKNMPSLTINQRKQATNSVGSARQQQHTVHNHHHNTTTTGSRERRQAPGMKKASSANQFARKQNMVNQSQVVASLGGIPTTKPPLAKKEEQLVPVSRQVNRIAAASKDFIVQNGMLKPRKQSSSVRSSRPQSSHHSLGYEQLLQPQVVPASSSKIINRKIPHNTNVADVGQSFTSGAANFANVCQTTPRGVGTNRSRQHSQSLKNSNNNTSVQYNVNLTDARSFPFPLQKAANQYIQQQQQLQQHRILPSTNKASSSNQRLSLKQLMGVAGTGSGGGGGTYFSSGRL